MEQEVKERVQPDVNPASARSEEVYRAARVVRAEHAESTLTRVVEQQAAKIPSDVFLVAALSAMVASLALELANHQRPARFVGMWAGPLLVMGVYNKLVKTFGPS